jgi:hypothetical protein
MHCAVAAAWANLITMPLWHRQMMHHLLCLAGKHSTAAYNRAANHKDEFNIGV